MGGMGDRCCSSLSCSRSVHHTESAPTLRAFLAPSPPRALAGMAAPQRPTGKVLHHDGGLYEPSLVYQHRRLPLGLHASEALAEATYDVAKLLVGVPELAGAERGWDHKRRRRPALPPPPPARRRRLHNNSTAPLPLQLARQLGKDSSTLKLHRPATSYTSHLLWAQLTGPHLSLDEACGLLAGGLAADFVEQPAGGRRELRRRQQKQGAGVQAGGLSLSTSVTEEESSGGGAASSGSVPASFRRGRGRHALQQSDAWCPSEGEETSGASGGWREATRRRQRGASEPGRVASQPPQGSRRGSSSKWSGLEEGDAGRYCMQVPHALVAAPGTSSTSLPGGRCFTSPCRCAH